MNAGIFYDQKICIGMPMIKSRSLILMPILLICYGSLFIAHDKHANIASGNISPSLPSGVLNVLGHSYMNQLIAETLFIKTAVYYGGLNQQMDERNLEVMGQHFLAISELHPQFLDTYYLSEAVLAHRGDPYVRIANRILEHGRAALPGKVALPFFEGFNYFHYLNDSIKAAEILRIGSLISGSPQWIGHLASILMAGGGNIRTGLIWLKGMLAASRGENEKTRYRKDILAFEKALLVQKAIRRYHEKYGHSPGNLEALQPEFIAELPQFKGDYVLSYQAPRLSLYRRHSR